MFVLRKSLNLIFSPNRAFLNNFKLETKVREIGHRMYCLNILQPFYSSSEAIKRAINVLGKVENISKWRQICHYWKAKLILPFELTKNQF